MITANKVLAEWNMLDEDAAVAAILPCCGSSCWARRLVQARPIADETELFDRSDAIWLSLPLSDWDEAFRSHPRIGERKDAATATQQSAKWSRQEQSNVDALDASIAFSLSAATAFTKSASDASFWFAPRANLPQKCWRSWSVDYLTMRRRSCMRP